MNERSDDELLSAARAGDRAAIEAVLAGQQQRLYRFGLKMCGDAEDAKEVLQESLLAAARALPTFEARSSLATWLYTIARSFCIKRRRRSKFLPAPEQSLEGDARREVARLADERPLTDELYASHELARMVDSALLSLDEEQREVLVLRDVEGLTAPEAAAVLGISIPALKSRLHRARASLRERLAPLLGTIEPASDSGCPDILKLFSENMEGEITAERCALMQEHMASCSRCRRACDSLKRVLTLCQRRSPVVPPEIQETVRSELRRVLHSHP
jgi:RNA polymerase sigma-70 factor (ECF subfamily)